MVAELQDALFEGDYTPVPSDFGFRGPLAQRVAGITYRQLDYWARTGLVVPSIQEAGGSGTQRLYSFGDILLLRVVKRFLDVGISLRQVRAAVDHLRARGISDVTSVTLVSDGFSVFEVTSANELYDLTRGGQGMFMISVSSVWKEIEGTLLSMPVERGESVADELAARRARAAG
ncbi:MerR family transcriptional regulator [Tessaracoccus sp. OH4464_COT-324]|uniref:MerR family transcriptional regulator n=1 Tax=Tessaracoccus sp. OH4464_COT-324 TaxID=2491059 RepID=UPI003515FC5A